MTPTCDDFERFFSDNEPRLRRAYGGRVGADRVGDAVAAALAYAWQNWARVQHMEHPVAYLFRVGLTQTRRRRQGALPPSPPAASINIEPQLVAAMQRLPHRQREVVWLVDGCHWTPTEAAEALGLSLSAVRTHRTRALDHLRHQLGVPDRE